MQKITPFLWFDTKALEAAKFYTSIFPNSKIHGQEQFENTGPDEKQTVQIVSFNLSGLEMQGMNAGPMFKFNPSISFFVKCASSEEVDELYNKLIEGGNALMALGKYDWSERYGWVRDKYGVTWQIMLHDQGEIATKITPCFLFTQKVFGKAEEALNLYTKLFKNSEIKFIQHYPAGTSFDGKVLFSEFILDGIPFIAMDGPGAHDYTFNEAISLMVDCTDQTEVDYFWNALTANGGAESQCGWLSDPFGVSWQIVPKALGESMSRDTSGNVMKAMLGMKKLIVSELEAACKNQ